MFRKKKLTKDEEYNGWITQIKRCRNGRQKMEIKWRRWYNIVDDMLWGDSKLLDGYQPAEVNQLATIIKNILPNISYKEGKVEIRAYSQDDMLRAAIYEKIGRNLVRQHRLPKQFQAAIFNTLVLGNGLMKVGYASLPLLAEPQWNAGLATERGAKPYSAYGMDWPLFEFLPDYRVDSWDKQRFFVHELDKHIDEITDNPMYDKKQVDKIKPTRRTEDIFYLGKVDGVDPKEDYVPVQEIHDLVNAEILIVAEKSGTDSYLYRGPEPFNMIPVENLSFFPRPMNVWGKGITQEIEHHLVSLSKMHTYMEKAMRRESLLKIMVDLSRWTKKDIDKLENSKDSVIGLAGMPEGSYDIMQFGAASKDFVFERGIALKKGEIREEAGAGRQQQGLHEPGVRTATESTVLQENADTINKWRAFIFSEFAASVIEKMIFIVSVTYEPERIAQMVGYPVESIAPLLQPYDPSKYVVSYGQAAMSELAERREKFMLFMQMFGQAINPAMALQMATDIFDLEYTDELLVPGQLLGGGGTAGGGGGQPATPGFRPPESQQQQGAI